MIRLLQIKSNDINFKYPEFILFVHAMLSQWFKEQTRFYYYYYMVKMVDLD